MSCNGHRIHSTRLRPLREVSFLRCAQDRLCGHGKWTLGTGQPGHALTRSVKSKGLTRGPKGRNGREVGDYLPDRNWAAPLDEYRRRHPKPLRQGANLPNIQLTLTIQDFRHHPLRANLR